MQNLMGSFPGLQQLVQQMVGTPGEPTAGAAGLGGVLGQIQGMLHPLLNQAAATASAQDPALQPAIQQILGGFASLTEALAEGASGGTGVQSEVPMAE